jgi:asparagine synthase (glutamine-hydrolysing)
LTSLAPHELATGIVFGSTRRTPALPASGATPAAALEAAVLAAVERGRCFVSFSGGRDSSAVLAAATQAARRHQLPEPIPLTIRAANEPNSLESDWQEMVVSHLELHDWIRIEVEDELDAVGPYASRALERHGLLWPFNAHFHLPMLDEAVGGTLLTGIGGDELWASSQARSLGWRRRLLGFAPYGVRRAVLRRRVGIDYPWLWPKTRRAVRRAMAGDLATQPQSVVRRMAVWRALRAITTGTAALDLLARDAGASICHPLLDRGLWGAVAAAAPSTGFAGREDALRMVASHLLPADVISRRTKASFDRVFFHEHARTFASEWAGQGVPEDVVNVAALSAHWSAETADPHSLTLMQAAWIASARERGEQAVSGSGKGVPVARTREPNVR